jgi:hypothetical protein
VETGFCSIDCETGFWAKVAARLLFRLLFLDRLFLLSASLFLAAQASLREVPFAFDVVIGSTVAE